MKKIEVTMKREDLKNIPDYSLPEGFRLRFFQEGDQADWVRVETAADEFESEEKAFERFNREFGPHLDEFSKRCVFLINENEEIIGTTTGWYGSLEEAGEIIGRIHWVSLLPEYHGKGLAKPLLTGAMNILAEHHTKAYLDSYTVNYKAINMYRQYGFKPVIRDDQDMEAWAILEEALNQKFIS